MSSPPRHCNWDFAPGFSWQLAGAPIRRHTLTERIETELSCRLLCATLATCAAYTFSANAVAAGTTRCVLAKSLPSGGPVNVAAAYLGPMNVSSDTTSGRCVPKKDVDAPAPLQPPCSDPVHGASPLHGKYDNLTLLVAGAPRTGSTWQHQALYEITLQSKRYSSKKRAFRLAYVPPTDGGASPARGKNSLVKVHQFAAAKALRLDVAADLVFVSTRPKMKQAASAFGTPWLAQELKKRNDPRAALLDWVKRVDDDAAAFARLACACCSQPFESLATRPGRLRLIAQYNALLGARLTTEQLELVGSLMEEWSRRRRAGPQGSSSELGRRRLDKALPRWRQVLKEATGEGGGGDKGRRTPRRGAGGPRKRAKSKGKGGGKRRKRKGS